MNSRAPRDGECNDILPTHTSPWCATAIRLGQRTKEDKDEGRRRRGGGGGGTKTPNLYCSPLPTPRPTAWGRTSACRRLASSFGSLYTDLGVGGPANHTPCRAHV